MKYTGIELLQYNGRHYFEDDTLAAKHDRRGPNEAKREAFIAKHGLRLSHSRVYPRWLALLPRGMKRCGFYSRWQGPAEAHQVMSYRVVDHDVLFVRNGGYIYTTQPYDLTLDKYQAVERYWLGLGLFVGISVQDAWWYPGRTPLIVIAEQPIALTGFRPDHKRIVALWNGPLQANHCV
jgi:hypothetical protein